MDFFIMLNFNHGIFIAKFCDWSIIFNLFKSKEVSFLRSSNFHVYFFKNDTQVLIEKSRVEQMYFRILSTLVCQLFWNRVKGDPKVECLTDADYEINKS